MACTTKSNTYSGLRNQTFANLKVCFPARFSDLEIVTSSIGGFKTAWVIDTKISTDSKDTPKAMVKGPPGSTSDEALEGLLEATSVLVGQELAPVFEQFQGELSVMVGEGFVREDVLCGREMGLS